MVAPATGLLAFVQTAGYPLLAVIFVVEGPITTFAAAMAASIGLLNVYLILALSALGNVIGDIVLYSVGRFGRARLVDRYGPRVGVTDERLRSFEGLFREHPVKTLLASKLFVPVPGLISAGVTRMDFRKFISLSIPMSTGYSLVFTLLGYYSGVSIAALSHALKIWDSVALLLIGGVIVVSIIMAWASQKGKSRFKE